jgi:membrane-associated phospholipid phosphatase
MTSGPTLNLLVPASFAILFLALWGAAYASVPWLLRSVRAVAGRVAAWLRGHDRLGVAFGRLETLRSYLPLVALAIGTVLIAVTADAFLEVASALATHDVGLQSTDAAVYDWVRLYRTPLLNTVFIGVTTGGGPVGMTAIVVVVAVVLTARRRFRRAAYLAITATGGVLLDQLLKALYTRQRPDLSGAILSADGYSFPSGHALNGTVILCAFGYLAARAELTWKSKSAVFAALVTLDLAIAASRLYLGVHWTSDVIGGLAAGLLWVAATSTGYELLRQYCERGARERAPAATPEAGSRPPVSS